MVQNMCLMIIVTVYIVFLTIQYSFDHDRKPSPPRCLPARSHSFRRPAPPVAGAVPQSDGRRRDSENGTSNGRRLLPKLQRDWNLRLPDWALLLFRIRDSGTVDARRWKGVFPSSCGVRQSIRLVIYPFLGFTIVIISDVLSDSK